MSSTRRFTFRKLFLTGFFFIIPIGVSYWFLTILITKMEGYARPLVDQFVRWTMGPQQAVPGWILTFVSVLLVILFILLIGALANFYFGKRVLGMIDWAMMKLPIVRGIYGGTKQILDAFSIQKSNAFKTVVLIEYPKKDCWVLGFLTSNEDRTKNLFGEHLSAVFVPSTPNPTTGFLLFLRAVDIRVVDISVEEAVKLIVSGGVVLPSEIRLRNPARVLGENESRNQEAEPSVPA
ncbi:MAG: DUF502 domain-containing protein [Acidobacteria bacterium]|nr:DUF502 domain-containing protein [Acidobacteriota bacterium]MCB9397040.1 DUF502 domain-containing protein [Acidobacteriota bacterium]